VQFYADGAALGSAVGLSSGAASTSTSALVGGAHAITATYSGNAAYNASAASTYTQTVTRLSTFTLTAIPNVLLANGVSTSTLSVMARDQDGRGAPFAGYVATISWTLGYYPSPVTVTLDAQGVATTTYTAGSTASVDVLTATIRDAYQSLAATTSITLNDNPLQGRLFSRLGPVITYTLIVSNASGVGSQVNVVVSGSIPANTQLVTVTGGSSVGTGGDYGWGYVTSPVIPALAPGECYTLTWSIRALSYVGDIVNTAHASSDTAVLRLALTDRVYRIFFMLVYRERTQIR
jgi:large repetitive protein